MGPRLSGIIRDPEPTAMTVRRTFWILSIANWLLAVAVWSVSAYLGIARPTSLFLPTTLFVVGIFAVLAGTLCWVVARFGQPPEPVEATDAEVTAAEAIPAVRATVAATESEVTAAEAIPAARATVAATQSEASATEPSRAGAIAAESAASPAVEPAGDAAPGEPGSAVERPLPAEAG
ncbi:MAG: hypothetical protein EHM52_05415 [Actinomycetota bacterium]|nr:MAG: hypothetical protein EHM52_05415 [Actinomycetota bacterium]